MPVPFLVTLSQHVGSGLVSHEDMSGEPSFRSGEEAEEMRVKGLPRGRVEGIVVKSLGSGVKL